MAALMVTKSLIFTNSGNSSLRRHHSSFPRTAANLSPNLVSLPRITLKTKTLVSKLSISSSPSTSPIAAATTTTRINTPSSSPPTTVFTESTRTISTVATIVFAAATAAVKLLSKASAQVLASNSVRTLGPLFMAASMKNRPSGYLNTPLTVVAAGLSKWLDIYSGVLMVRVLLSWFPNIPWDRQPLSAIRDLCDPYLNLFRNIIPPVFDTLDVSPLLAFAVLGVLGSILTNSRGAY